MSSFAGVLDHTYDLTRVFFHGSRHAQLKSLRASTGGEFGPGVYLTSFEPTAQFYANHVARGPDAPTIYRVRVSVQKPYVVTKSDWVKKTERSSPGTIVKRLQKQGYDCTVGVANNGYEWQLVVFDTANVIVVP